MQPQKQLQQFEISTFTSIDGSGNATAKLGPSYPREWWYLDKAGIFIPGTIAGYIICTVYVGAVASPVNMVDQSYLGAGDSTGRVAGHSIHAGEYVWAVWQLAPINKTAFLTVWGSK